MATVFDVARYILDKKGKMTSLKLQKLCYYSQAWHYTWTGETLFDEQFEAWKNGPVCPELFAAHKGMYNVKPENIKGNPDSLTADQKESIDVVLNTYGDMQSYELREQTHQEAPWLDMRAGLREDEVSHNVITPEAMGRYYAER